MLSSRQRGIKRGFDLVLSLLLVPVFLVPCLVLMPVIALMIHPRPWFRQLRIGQYGASFYIYKLRTLKHTQHQQGQEARDTNAFGRFLRRFHIDEWPQLLNILKGDMSFVGPRPDVPGFADQLDESDSIILELKPGLTGPASIKYHREDLLLQAQADPETYYRKIIWPDKVEINKNYLRNYRFSLDLLLLLKTLQYAFK